MIITILTLLTLITTQALCLPTHRSEIGGCESTMFGCCDDNSTQCFLLDCSDCPSNFKVSNHTNHSFTHFTNMSGFGYLSGYGSFSNLTAFGYFFNLTGLGNLTTSNQTTSTFTYHNFTNLTGMFLIDGFARLENITGLAYFYNVTGFGNLTELGSFQNHSIFQ